LLLKKEVVERPELQAILKVVSIEQGRERRKSGNTAEGENPGSARQ
jgi:hypothetical protein